MVGVLDARQERPLRFGQLGFDIGNIFTGHSMEFTADEVSGEAKAEERTKQGSDLAVIDLAPKEFQFALDALADNGSFVGVLGGFFERGFDVLVWNASGAEFAGHAVLALFA